MKNKSLVFKKLLIPDLMQAAFILPTVGELNVSADNLTYLNINDNYIHHLFPLLLKPHPYVEKPDYFDTYSMGAHISVMYPEENVFVSKEDIGQEHHFKVQGMFSTRLDLKHYYVLVVEAPSLLALRKKYGLGDKLCFKGYLIHFHITVGVRSV